MFRDSPLQQNPLKLSTAFGMRELLMVLDRMGLNGGSPSDLKLTNEPYLTF